MAARYLEPASGPFDWLRQPGERRRRAISVALTILVHILIIWLLLSLTPKPPPQFGDGGALSTFNVGPQAKQAATKRQTHRAAAKAAPTPPRPILPPLPPSRIKQDDTIIWMTKDQFAKTDITNLGRDRAKGEQTAANDAADAGDGGPPGGKGEGPGGATLYNAEWYREPRDAELRPFLPAAPPDSWAMIACRTIPNNRVENCQTLGESPLGSGLATGLRRAAWQFLIRPPRVGGKPVLGAWVRIRFTFTEHGGTVHGG